MKWECIIIHHSLTPDKETVSWGAIRRYHTEALKWKDIGYHFGIELIGDYYEVLVGRLLTEVGAHTLGMNDKGIGICCVGNYDTAPPPEAMIEKLVLLVRWLMDVYHIPKSKVYGHNFFADKTCPGEMFDVYALREIL